MGRAWETDSLYEFFGDDWFVIIRLANVAEWMTLFGLWCWYGIHFYQGPHQLGSVESPIWMLELAKTFH